MAIISAFMKGYREGYLRGYNHIRERDDYRCSIDWKSSRNERRAIKMGDKIGNTIKRQMVIKRIRWNLSYTTDDNFTFKGFCKSVIMKLFAKATGREYQMHYGDQ